jgi:hypothetical protein
MYIHSKFLKFASSIIGLVLNWIEGHHISLISLGKHLDELFKHTIPVVKLGAVLWYTVANGLDIIFNVSKLRNTGFQRKENVITFSRDYTLYGCNHFKSVFNISWHEFLNLKTFSYLSPLLYNLWNSEAIVWKEKPSTSQYYDKPIFYSQLIWNIKSAGGTFYQYCHNYMAEKLYL